MHAQIGDIILRNEYGFSGFSLVSSRRWPEHPLINVKPKIETTGLELDKLSFGLTLHRFFCVPETERNKFLALVESGIPVTIILGNGLTLGNYVLTELEQNIIHSASDGNIYECEIKIKAIEYTGKLPSNRVAIALSTSSPEAQAIVTVPIPTAGAIGNSVVQAQNEAEEITRDLEKASEPVNREKSFRSIALRIQNIEKDLKGAYIASSNAIRLANDAQQLRDKITRTLADLDQMKNYVAIRDLDGARSANTAFQSNVSNISSLAGPFTASYALRKSV